MSYNKSNYENLPCLVAAQMFPPTGCVYPPMPCGINVESHLQLALRSVMRPTESNIEAIPVDCVNYAEVFTISRHVEFRRFTVSNGLRAPPGKKKTIFIKNIDFEIYT